MNLQSVYNAAQSAVSQLTSVIKFLKLWLCNKAIKIKGQNSPLSHLQNSNSLIKRFVAMRNCYHVAMIPINASRLFLVNNNKTEQQHQVTMAALYLSVYISRYQV